MSIKKSNQNKTFQEQNNSRKGITLMDVLSICFNKITMIVFFTFIITALVACFTYYELLGKTSVRISVLNFSLMFDGVKDGKYPNGSKFVETDILATPVLRKVFNDSDLKCYYGSFTNFKNTISIQRYNPGLAFLNSEYKAKLSSKNLSSAQRYEIEQEFYRQTANIEAKPIFSLVSIFPGGGTTYNIPVELMSKILNNTLTTWLAMAKEYQGVTKYDISLVSNKVEEQFIEDVDYFSSVDFMRLLLEDLMRDVGKIEQLPNTKLIKIEKNNKRYTLKDLKLKIRYIKNYILTPLLELIKSSGAYKNKQRTVVYLESQINNLNEQIDILQEKKDNYENLLLEHYISSHEPIIRLSGDVLKLKNEIVFYQKFLDSIKPCLKKVDVEKINEIVKLQKSLLNSENLIIELIYDFYEKANQHNLDSIASFFRINSFSSYVSYKLNKKLIIKRSVTYWVAAEVILLFLIIGTSYFKKDNNRYSGEGMEQVRVYTQFRALPEKSESLDKRKEIPK